MKTQFSIRKAPLLLGTIALLSLSTTFSHAQTLTAQGKPTARSAATTDTYNPWAMNTIHNLQSARKEIVLIDSNGDKLTALNKWEQAIQEVLDTAARPETHSSLIYRIAEGTLALAQSLEESSQREAGMCPMNDNQCFNRSLAPTFEVYEHGYDMIIKYQQFDRDSYHRMIQNLTTKVKPGTNEVISLTPASTDTLALETQLRDYALDQLAWFSSKFQIGKDPKYSHDVYYSVLNAVLKQVVSDLSGGCSNSDPSLFPSLNASPIDLMQRLSKKLEHHLADNRAYGQEPGPFWFFNGLLSDIISSLSKR